MVAVEIETHAAAATIATVAVIQHFRPNHSVHSAGRHIVRCTGH
jgi:hypothetical protein